MDMDQGSQDGGGGGEIPKNKIINGNGIQKPPILEDSGVTSQAMDVSSPTPLDQKKNNNHKSNIKKVPKQTIKHYRQLMCELFNTTQSLKIM